VWFFSPSVGGVNDFPEMKALHDIMISWCRENVLEEGKIDDPRWVVACVDS